MWGGELGHRHGDGEKTIGGLESLWRDKGMTNDVKVGLLRSMAVWIRERERERERTKELLD